jgi:hypothetical protein
MTQPLRARKRDYARAVAWFVELTRAHELDDRDREALARQRLREMGVAARITSPDDFARVVPSSDGGARGRVRP